MSLFSLMATLGLDSSGYEKGLNEAEGSATSFGNKLKSGLVGAGKLAAGAVTAISTAAVGASVAMVKGASNVAVMGDNIDKMSQKMGLSAEAYQEWDAILQHSGTSIESMTRGMTTLSKAAETNKDEFKKLGITEEELRKLNQEELFARTIEGLQNMESGTERTVLASTLLGGSAKELGALLNTTAEDTEAMRQRVHELGGVMSDEAIKNSAAFQDNLQDLQTALDGAKRGIMEGLLPGLNSLMEGFTGLILGEEGAEEAISVGLDGLFDSISSGLSRVMEIGAVLLPELGETLLEHIPDLVPSILGILEQIANTIVENTPMLIQTALDVLLQLGDAILSNPGSLMDAAAEVIDSLALWIGEYSSVLLEMAVQILTNMVTSLTDPTSISMIVDAALFLVTSLADGILNAIPVLIEAVPTIIENITTVIGENLPKILQSGQEILMMVVNGITENIPLLVDTILQVIDSITGFITDNLPMILQMGIDILMSLIDGIMDSIPELIDAALEVVMSLLDFFTQNLPLIITMGMEMLMSLVEGILDNLPQIIDAVMTVIQTMTQWIIDNLPMLIQMGMELIFSLVQGLLDNIPAVISAITQVIMSLLGWVVDNLPMIIQMGITVIQSLAQGLLDNIPAIISAITDIIMSLIGWITDNLDLVIDSGITLIMSLIDGLIDALPELIPAALEIIMAIVSGLLDNIPQLITAAIELMIQLAIGLVQAIPQIVARIPEIISGIVNAFINFDWAGLGGQIINGIKNGILNIGSTLWEGVKSVGQGLLNGFKSLFGIASPSKVFRDQVGKMIGEGLAEGIDKSAIDAVNAAESMAEDVLGEMDTLNGFNADYTANMLSDSGLNGAGYMGGNKSIVINVYGAEGQNVNELAEIISQKIAFGYRQEQMVWA